MLSPRTFTPGLERLEDRLNPGPSVPVPPPVAAMPVLLVQAAPVLAPTLVVVPQGIGTSPSRP